MWEKIWKNYWHTHRIFLFSFKISTKPFKKFSWSIKWKYIWVGSYKASICKLSQKRYIKVCICKPLMYPSHSVSCQKCPVSEKWQNYPTYSNMASIYFPYHADIWRNQITNFTKIGKKRIVSLQIPACALQF